MAIIQVQVRKNFIEDVLLDGGYGVNFIMEKLRVQLGMSKPKPTPYNMRMVNQTITKPLRLIKDLRILVHGIPYAVIFTIIQSSVLDSSYFTLLGRPWLMDAKMFHDWATSLLLYKEPIQLEPYMLLRNLEHQPSVHNY
jgi:hypothetical protein